MGVSAVASDTELTAQHLSQHTSERKSPGMRYPTDPLVRKARHNALSALNTLRQRERDRKEALAALERLSAAQSPAVSAGRT